MVAWSALRRELSFFIPLPTPWPFPGIITFQVSRYLCIEVGANLLVTGEWNFKPGAGRWYTMWTSCFQVLELFAKADNCAGNVQHNLQLLDEPWLVLRTLLVILEFCIPLYHHLNSPYCSITGINGFSYGDLLFLHYRFALLSSMQIAGAQFLFVLMYFDLFEFSRPGWGIPLFGFRIKEFQIQDSYISTLSSVFVSTAKHVELLIK